MLQVIDYFLPPLQRLFLIALTQWDFFVLSTLQSGAYHFVLNQPFYISFTLSPPKLWHDSISGTPRLSGMIYVVCIETTFDDKFISFAVGCCQMSTNVHGLNLK